MTQTFGENPFTKTSLKNSQSEPKRMKVATYDLRDPQKHHGLEPPSFQNKLGI
jgi:hypothetical protein